MVKEINLAVSNQFKVQVICFEFDNWSKENNEKIIASLSHVKFIRISTSKSNISEWLLSSFVEKSLFFLNRIFKLSPKLISFSISKRSFLLTKYVNKIKNADIVVGHNPGALYATYFASRKFKCKSGFDVEDYHPGEGNNKKQQHLLLELMKNILPKMDYVSFASSLIKDEVEKKVFFSKNINLFIILNYFSKTDFIINNDIDVKKIKLVWFSQNIDFNRGLEQIIPILKVFKQEIELHLYGNFKNSFYEKYKNLSELLFFHPPLEQISLHKTISNYDCGLSLENINADFNREICLTNKIITYFQSGLFILATDTPAQKLFLNEHPNHGITFNKDFSNFEHTLLKTIENISKIRMEKTKRFNDSQNYNWENESGVILKNWNTI